MGAGEVELLRALLERTTLLSATVAEVASVRLSVQQLRQQQLQQQGRRRAAAGQAPPAAGGAGQQAQAHQQQQWGGGAAAGEGEHRGLAALGIHLRL